MICSANVAERRRLTVAWAIERSETCHVKVAIDRGISGVLESSCAYFAKHPPIQIPDEVAYQHLHEFIIGKRER